MDELAQRHLQWERAVNAGDIDAYADLVTHDLVWIPPTGDAIVGRQAFREWLGPFFEAYDYVYSTSNTRFLGAGDWGAEKSEFESRMTPVAGGATLMHAGAYVVIWRRDTDGAWRIDRYLDHGPLAGR